MFKSFYRAVQTIPKGRVASYGFVAKMAGYPGCGRQVGWALHQNPNQSEIPCHRVVKKDGSLSEAFAFGGISEHARLLQNENVPSKNGKVDMKLFSLDYIK